MQQKFKIFLIPTKSCARKLNTRMKWTNTQEIITYQTDGRRKYKACIDLQALKEQYQELTMTPQRGMHAQVRLQVSSINS